MVQENVNADQIEKEAENQDFEKAPVEETEELIHHDKKDEPADESITAEVNEQVEERQEVIEEQTTQHEEEPKQSEYQPVNEEAASNYVEPQQETRVEETEILE